MRIAALALAALAVFGAAAVAIGEARGWPFLRAPMARGLARAADVPVDFGKDADRFALKLIGRPSLEVASLTVGAAPGPAAPYLLSGRDLRLAWRWSDAWRWWRGSAPLRIASLDARTLDMNLLRDSDGRATWQIGPGASKGSPLPAGQERLDLPKIGMLSLGGGRIAFDDEPLATRLVVTVEGRENEDAGSRSPSGWRARVEGRWKALPLRLTVVTGGAMPLMADMATADIGLRVEGQVGAARVIFDGRAGAILGALRLDGELKFSGPSLARVAAPLGLSLPQTPPFELEGRLSHNVGLWQLKARSMTTRKSRLRGEFLYDTRADLPKLTGQLNGTRLALADLGPAIGAPASGTAAAPSVLPPNAAGRVLPHRRFDLPSLKAIDADVQLAFDELDFGTDALAPLRNVTTRVVLNVGRLELQQVKATVAGGTMSGTSSYASVNATAQWTARMRLTGIDAAGWLRGTQTSHAADAPPAGPTQAAKLKQERQQARQGGDQLVRNYVTGALDAEFDVRGTGDSTGQILSTLNGRLDLTLRDGTLSHLATEAAGLDLAQGLGVIIRGDRPLPLRCARIQATARNGIVRTDLGVIDNADSTLLLAGELNLKDETLALVVTSKPKDFSPLSLRTPITVRGTLAQPRIGVDGGKLLGKVGVAAALGAALGPIAALIPLIDVGRKEAGDPCAAATPTTPPNAASR